MITHLLRSLFFFTSIALSVATIAAEPLNADTVNRWVESQKAFTAWGEEHQSVLRKYEETNEGPENPLSLSVDDMLRPLNESGLGQSASAVVKRFGFVSLESWADTTLRITRAAAAIQVESQQGSLDTSKLEALKQSGKLSKQQQAVVSSAIRQNNSMLNYLKNQVSEEDKDAVKPHLKKLQTLFETY